MSFLLDTNVVSEWVKPQPDPNVVSWLVDVDEDRVFNQRRVVRRDPPWNRADACWAPARALGGVAYQGVAGKSQ